MNKQKTKKLAFAAVAVVMAGSMMFSLAACTPTGGNGGNGNGNDPAGDYIPDTSHLEQGLIPTFANGKLSYTDGTELNINAGNNSGTGQGIGFGDGELLTAVKLPDGNEYETDDLKPAWAALSEEMGINFVNKYTNKDSNKQLTDAITAGITQYDVITASAAAMTQNTGYLLDLSDYLDFMPNYKAFLEANPAVYYSLTSDSQGSMYYAPYFDGLNDIEKYVLAEQTWISDLLTATDSQLNAETTTFAAQAAAKNDAITDTDANGTDITISGTSASVESYMGETGSWEVDTTSLDGNSVVKGKVDYGAALAAATSESSALGAAIVAAKGSAYTGKSGNIVDIMNDVINTTNGAVTGGQLTKILQEYIKVTYTVGGTAYTNIADVFNSVSALWDVDLLVAISRCAVSSPTLLGASASNLSNIYGIAARRATTQRRVDLTAFVGELYGIRGMESRAEYTYIDKDGVLQDARADAETYELMAQFSTLATEGLLFIGGYSLDQDNAGHDPSVGISPLFMHDYSQTQTVGGFTDDDYNMSPILTSVSHWDTNGDGERETTMRFTESWRSVKNTGFCVPIESVRNNANKLSAVLAFIDYLFSNDGQILMTYGAQDTTNNSANPNGWWYADVATGVQLEDVAERVSITTLDNQTNYSDQYQIKPEYESQYFIYKNTVYKGMVNYNRAIPKITTANETFFSGGEVNGIEVNDGSSNKLNASAYNYTNYARWVIGTTLPIGNKDQGFEYQCTADCALEGAAVVSQALLNGTIKHVKLALDAGESMWYLIAPTSFMLNTDQQSTINSAKQSVISGQYFLNNSKTDVSSRNALIDLIFYGFDTNRQIIGSETLGRIPENGEAYVTLLNSAGLEERITIYKNAWRQTALYFGLIGGSN